MKAVWNGETIAESNNTILIEGNHYFPVDSIKQEYFEESDTNTVCHWKGTASYYHVKIDGKENRDAAWYYPEPKEMAKEIKHHVAFWRGVEIVK
jgi:uncharacterized protein (DUF427 family)